MNGDQIQYEIDNANVAARQRSDWPMPSFEAKDWAEAMSKQFGIAEDELLTWCATMLMRGFDEHAARSSGERARLRQLLRRAGGGATADCDCGSCVTLRREIQAELNTGFEPSAGTKTDGR